jgi:hypothetical protein
VYEFGLDLYSYIMYCLCMTKPETIADLINCWPTIGAFADDIGCGYEAARKMRDRNSIAADHWSKVVEVCRKRRIRGVTLSWLAEMRAVK